MAGYTVGEMFTPFNNAKLLVTDKNSLW